jgi:hypothetical protein
MAERGVGCCRAPWFLGGMGSRLAGTFPYPGGGCRIEAACVALIAGGVFARLERDSCKVAFRSEQSAAESVLL